MTGVWLRCERRIPIVDPRVRGPGVGLLVAHRRPTPMSVKFHPTLSIEVQP